MQYQYQTLGWWCGICYRIANYKPWFPVSLVPTVVGSETMAATEALLTDIVQRCATAGCTGNNPDMIAECWDTSRWRVIA